MKRVKIQISEKNKLAGYILRHYQVLFIGPNPSPGRGLGPYTNKLKCFVFVVLPRGPFPRY